MINDTDFETYFYLSPTRLTFSVFKKDSKTKIITDEFIIQENSNNIDFEKVEILLEKNIFEIEKKTQTFLNDVCLIIDSDDSLPIDMSFRQNNEGLEIKQKDLHYLLKDAKQQVKKYYYDKSIIHLIIENYFFDNIHYSYFPENLICNNFLLEIRFICFSKKMIKKIERIFQKHQIFISKVICGKYTKEFYKDSKTDICEMGLNIRNGCNDKEVLLVPKIEEKKGFFEKFFNLFG
tara:strand:+ start:975 stop:1679 length:705 start_codon:yes stop_codon:yes gene_type:complete